MKKWVCPVCGYVYEGENPPAECPVCHVSGDKFTLQAEEKTWAAEHVVGVGKVFGEDVPAEVREEIIAGLRANFEGECSEVGMYLAMARVAHREARYMPTSVHSPVKLARRSSMMSSGAPWATPTTCSAAQLISGPCSTNLDAGAWHWGHSLGGCSPS